MTRAQDSYLGVSLLLLHEAPALYASILSEPCPAHLQFLNRNAIPSSLEKQRGQILTGSIRADQSEPYVLPGVQFHTV